MPAYRFRSCFVVAYLLAALPGLSLGQEETPAEAQTTADPTIAIDKLDWLLLPMTMEQLAVEADGWRDLVAAKVTEEASAEIQVLLLAEQIDAEQTAAAENQEAAEGDEPPTDSNPAAEPPQEESESAAEQERAALIEKLPDLRTERAALIERSGVVLAAWSAKGGDPSSHQTYLDKVSGLVNVDLTDVSATRAAVRGWVMSPEGGIRWGLNIVKSIVILIAFWLMAKLTRRLVARAVLNSKLTSLMKSFIVKMSGRTVMAVGLVMAVSALGMNVGPLLAVVGAAGFVVAFALQDSLGNFASGIMILIYRPFDVGDLVEVSGAVGKVDSLNLVSTTIRTLDNKVVVVPNNKIWGDVIVNATGSHQRRVDLVFGIGYEDDMAQAQGIMEQVLTEHPKVLKDPEPVVKVHELGDSSVNFICRPWVKTDDYWDVYWDVTRKVKEEFDQQGVSIPFPQRDVHVHQHGNGAQASIQSA